MIGIKAKEITDFIIAAKELPPKVVTVDTLFDQRVENDVVIKEFYLLLTGLISENSYITLRVDLKTATESTTIAAELKQKCVDKGIKAPFIAGVVLL